MPDAQPWQFFGPRECLHTLQRNRYRNPLGRGRATLLVRARATLKTRKSEGASRALARVLRLGCSDWRQAVAQGREGIGARTHSPVATGPGFGRGFLVLANGLR